MRTALLTFIAATLLAGCGFDDPSPTVIGVDCGVENLELGGEMDQAGRQCLLEAFEVGTPAQFTSRMISIEGDPIVRTYVVLGPGDLRIAHDARQDRFGSGTIEYLRCARLVPVEDWNEAQVFPDVMPEDVVFVEDGCEPYSA
jgi:hypothetical protein